MGSEALLLWGVLFSSIGLGFFIYGKKQSRLVPFLCGLTLMAYPYFVESVPLLIGVGVALSVLPYFLKL